MPEENKPVEPHHESTIAEVLEVSVDAEGKRAHFNIIAIVILIAAVVIGAVVLEYCGVVDDIVEIFKVTHSKK
jgi:hypothetical protein